MAHRERGPFVAVIEQLGPAKVSDFATAAGANLYAGNEQLDSSPRADQVLSAALTPLGQAAAFASFAADGPTAPAHLVRRITDAAGKVVHEAARQPGFAGLTPRARAAVAQAVSGQAPVLSGDRPAFGVAGIGMERDVVTDAWMTGATSELAVSVWLGAGSGVRAPESAPLVIWKSFLDRALEGTPVRPLPTG
jgi:membrane peptidoglycan carboxypeptidase